MIPIPFDYETLRVIWWLLLGMLLIGFAVMDGFDLGVAMLLPWVAKNDNERRVVINTVGPVWEGNQVWIILGGGATFAAWPFIYALSFSSFYLAILLILLALILRPVAFKYRSKLPEPRWRQTWDWILFASGIVAAFVFGIAVGNVLQGIPFHYDADLRVFYTGSFWSLLNPFALLCGLLSIAMLITHGGIYLTNKTVYALQTRAKQLAIRSAVITMILFALGGVWIAWGMTGYVLAVPLSHDAPSNPLHKEVVMATGAWLQNYREMPWMLLAPILGFLGMLMAVGLLKKAYYRLGMLASAVAIAGIIATVGLSMFPFILPSKTHASQSLLVWDASSSRMTLFVMLVATIIFMPIILVYTSWVYRVLRGKVTVDTIQSAKDEYY